MAGVGNGCPKYDQLKPIGIQELTHSRFRDLTSDDRGVSQGHRLVAGDGNNFHNLILMC